ncbi:MAG: hypothetical protein OCC45_06405 [Desulfotalea sp.]
MESWAELVSFWGGLASILALFFTFIGGVIVLLKNSKAKYNSELKRLDLLKSRIANRAKSATTQGKRIDLFIYYQSEFKNRHFSQLVEEIQACTMHICSLIIFLLYYSLDANASYYIDLLVPFSTLFYDNYSSFLLTLFTVLALLNFVVRMQIIKQRDSLEVVTNTLAREFQNLIK